MPYYQHYSFDLWLTLIKSNPDFKTERAGIFHRDFNAVGKSLDEVVKAFRQVDIMCNAINECTGKNIDADEMYLMVISLINGEALNVCDIAIEQLYQDMEALVFNYLPVVYSPVTMDVLQHLKQNGDCSLSILSNTGFIKGQTLRKVLMELGLSDFFNFQIYSDEEGMSKPNLALFELAFERIKNCNQYRQMSLNTIVHVGDNPRADIAGAQAAGMKTQLINSNNLSISTLLN